MKKILVITLAYLLVIAAPIFSEAQVFNDNERTEPNEAIIEKDFEKNTDIQIKERIENIFNELEDLKGIEVMVNSGVATLNGSLATEKGITKAEKIASRVEDVVTVQNNIERDYSVDKNVSPLLEKTRNQIDFIIKTAPLFLFALVVFLLIFFFGKWVSNREKLWQRLAPNNFLADLIANAVFVIFIVIALSTALNLIGATTIFAGMLGAVSVIGLGISFAIRDTLENYISSIMLSIRQPFRAGDHVLINDYEGRVARLTTRATILITLDGNHLRIPNSEVFKAVILNYTTNPERRLIFEIGVDASDDPIAAINLTVEELNKLGFVLQSPETSGHIKNVGDSNIVLIFKVWINQSETDYYKARTTAIRSAIQVLEANGFSIPEPIYKLRFDGNYPINLPQETKSKKITSGKKSDREKPKPKEVKQAEFDVSADTDFEQTVSEEAEKGSDENLLSEEVPVE